MGVDYGYGDKKPSPFGKKPRGRIIWEKPRIPKPKPKPAAPGKAPGKRKPINRSGRGL